MFSPEDREQVQLPFVVDLVDQHKVVEIDTKKLKDDIVAALHDGHAVPDVRTIGYVIEVAIKGHTDRLAQLRNARDKFGRAGLLDEPLDLIQLY